MAVASAESGMSAPVDIKCVWRTIDDLPAALRTGAVSTPEGCTRALSGLDAKTMLILARRIEDAAPRFVVVEVEKPRGEGQALLDAAWATLHIWVWVYGIVPALARVIIGALQ